MPRLILVGFLLVVLTAGPAPAQCTFFTDHGAFQEFNMADGKFPKGIETFEESDALPGEKLPVPAPLGPDPSPGFPNGLEMSNLVLWDNVTPGPSPPALNPSGFGDALFIGGGVPFTNSEKVGEDLEVLYGTETSLDLVFTSTGKTGIGFWLSQFDGFGFGDWTITVYDADGNILGVDVLTAPPLGEPGVKTFWGVWCPTSIARINIWDECICPDVVDDIELWVSPPTPIDATSWGSVKNRYAD